MDARVYDLYALAEDKTVVAVEEDALVSAQGDFTVESFDRYSEDAKEMLEFIKESIGDGVQGSGDDSLGVLLGHAGLLGNSSNQFSLIHVLFLLKVFIGAYRSQAA
jgi:hypothetical protein